MAGFWIHPNGRPEGGGGELPEVITWGMIQGKPTEFKPTKHNHEMEEIINLEETISEIYVMINDKVSKETGKQLSEENFTTALKEKLESMENGTVGVISVNGKEGQHIQITKNDLGLGNVLDVAQVSQEEFNTLKERVDNLTIEGGTVTSVNGMTGEVIITKETLDLNRVLNETQATKTEFDTHTQDSNIHVTNQEKILWNAKEDSESVQLKINSASLENMEYTDSKVVNKVDKENGKGLSTNDFTDEYVKKIDNMTTSEVTSVNGKKGNVVITKADLNLSNVQNVEQVSLAEFEDYKKHTTEIIREKVDKVSGKDLSSNDFTNQDKLKLNALPNASKIVKTVNEKTPIEGNIQLTKSDVGLSNVLNEEQATKVEFETLQVKTLENTENLKNKVDVEEGKGLSTNDFTNALKSKLEGMESGGGELPSGEYVISINGKSGTVEIDKKTVGLPNVLNEKQVVHTELEALSSDLNQKLTTKVNSEEGKGLSEANFTHAEKSKLSLINEEVLEHPVTSVNGKIGDVILNNADIGLSNIKNIEQATKTEFDTHISDSVKHVTSQEKENWNSKESPEEAQAKATKALEDAKIFTTEEIAKIPEVNIDHLETKADATTKLQEAKKYTDTKTTNMETTTGSQTKATKALNDAKAFTTAEIAKIPETDLSDLETKVDANEKLDNAKKYTDSKVLGLETTAGAQVKATKALTDAKEYTDTKISEIPKFDDKHLATKIELTSHTGNNNVHVNEVDKTNINKIPKIELDMLKKVDKENGKGLSTNDFTTAYKNKVEQFDTLSATISTHINDSEVHLSEEQKNLVDGLPELTTDVQAMDNEIERILELLGEGGEVPTTGVLEVIKKGHLYMLGNEIFDIIHKNKVVGTMARAFVRDNIHLFESENFMYNTIEFNGIGQITSEFVRQPLPDAFEGVFKDVLDFSNMMLHDKLVINGEFVQEFNMEAKWLGNTFKLGVSYDDFEDLTTSNLTLGKKASVSLSLDVDITAPNFKPFTSGMGYNITNNTFVFEDLHDHTIKFESKLIFEDATEIKSSLIYVNLENNIITINKRDNHKNTIFKYNVNNATPLVDEWDKSLYIGIEPVIKNNKICDELLRRSGNVFPYIPERQVNSMKPILDNATITHTLSMEMDIRPNVKFGTNELEKELQSNNTSPLANPNLKNIVIVNSIEELQNIEPYEGLIAIVKG